MQEAFLKAAFLPLLVLGSTFVIAAENSAGVKVYPYRLSDVERSKLSELVCRTRHGLDYDTINAWTEKPRDTTNIRASVACQPHASTEHYRTYYLAKCQRGVQWECSRSERHLHADLTTGQVDIATNWYNPELVYNLVSKIASYRNIDGDLVFEPDTRQCQVAKGPSKEMLDITCDDRLFRLSYWCPKSSCPRIFSINGFFVPADAGGL